jgi:hypothetical protein
MDATVMVWDVSQIHQARQESEKSHGAALKVRRKKKAYSVL